MYDPYYTLNVDYSASDTEIRQAYLNAIRLCPPDKDPKQFNAIRQAYEKISDEKKRIAYELFQTAPPPFTEIIKQLAPTIPSKPPGQGLFEAIMTEKIS